MNNKKEFFNEENYQKSNEKVKKIGNIIIIIGLVLLIGGILVSMAVGVKYKSTKFDIVNGIIMTLIFIGFLSFMMVTR